MTKGRNVPGSPRAILLRAKHSPEGFANLTITYVHRGAAGDVKTVAGAEVADVDRGLLELRAGTQIPMHRIVEIRDGERSLFLRRPR